MLLHIKKPTINVFFCLFFFFVQLERAHSNGNHMEEIQNKTSVNSTKVCPRFA